MAPVVDVSRETLVERRLAILESLGTDEAALRDLEETRSLTAEEWDAKEELDAIAFLLGDTDA